MLLITRGLVDVATGNINEEHLFFLAGYLGVVIAFLDFILVLKLLITHWAQKLVIVGVLLDHLLFKSNTLRVIPLTLAFALDVDLVIVFALTDAIGIFHVTPAAEFNCFISVVSFWLGNLTTTVSLARCR